METTSAHKNHMFAVVRDAARRALGVTTTGPASIEPIPGEFDGAFVTFYKRAALRGCVGSFERTRDLASLLARVTAATLRDKRFENNPVTPTELSSLDIEVSVLTDFRETREPKSLMVGIDGVRVEMDNRSGCFLPKVATDRRWSAAEFLSNCCTMKAGLAPDAWRDPRCRVQLFKAHVFREPFDSDAAH